MANWIKFGDHGAVNLDLISSYRVYPGMDNDIMAVFICGATKVCWNYSDLSGKCISDFSEFRDVYKKINEFIINCINNPSDKIRFLEDYIKEDSDLRINRFINDFLHDFSVEIRRRLESDQSYLGIGAGITANRLLEIDCRPHGQKIKTETVRRFFWEILMPSIDGKFLGKIKASPIVSLETEQEYDCFGFLLGLDTDLIKKDIPKIRK